jgi:plasmid stabilization system protein ParE
MSSPRLEFHVEAAEEVRAAVDWYEQRNPGAARAFALELDHAIEQIRDAPTRWPSHLHGTRYCPMRRFPYLVVYRELDNGLEVVAIAHGRRRPGYWKNRASR